MSGVVVIQPRDFHKPNPVCLYLVEAESDLEDLELSLRALEKLDRSSPDLWPEQIPGVNQFIPPTPSTNHSSPSAQVLTISSGAHGNT